MNAIDIFQRALHSLCDKIPSFTLARPRRALSNTELFFIFSYIMEKKPSSFFESGFYKGRSTLILLECLKQCGLEIPYFVASIHRRKELDLLQSLYPNLKICYKVGENAIDQFKGKTAGALLDGPKLSHHLSVFLIYNKLIERHDCVFICQHDIDVPESKIKLLQYYNTISSNFVYKIMDNEFASRFIHLETKREIRCDNLGVFIRK